MFCWGMRIKKKKIFQSWNWFLGYRQSYSGLQRGGA